MYNEFECRFSGKKVYSINESESAFGESCLNPVSLATTRGGVIILKTEQFE